MLKKAITVGLIASALYIYSSPHSATTFISILTGFTETAGKAEDAFRNYESGVMVTAEGTVDRLLADDNAGRRHQRFIVRLASGQTLLVAHNIDLSTRVPIQLHTPVKLHGQYEWSDKGGTVHWTHRDPQQKHEGGWIEVEGRRYN